MLTKTIAAIDKNRLLPAYDPAVKSVCIQGGTFRPIHPGHTTVAKNTADFYKFDQFWFMPNFRQPLKEAAAETPEQIFALCSLAVSGLNDTRFKVSNIEHLKKGTSYTIETIRVLKKIYPEYKFHFQMSIDEGMDLLKWKDTEQLIGECQLIVCQRKGHRFSLSDFDKYIADSRLCHYRDMIWTPTAQQVPSIEFDARKLRPGIAAGRDFSGVLHQSVWEYITENKLFGWPG